jgi:hypothetical protein
MVQGFTFETEGAKRVITSWVEGAPKKRFWGGSKVPPDGGIPVGTFRCAACGFLEFYAREEFAAE